MVEGVHFVCEQPASALGHKILSVNLSDLAAMGAEPAWVTLNLVLPEANLSWLQKFSEGFFELADRYSVVLVGGDPILNITISLRTIESEIAESITEIQNKNKDVEIGSYPFFKAGKLGVSIVLRSSNKNNLEKCNSEVVEFVKSKNIEILGEI